ncbi:RNA polymerase sigma factor [Sporanaerobacter sp. PP17-6a]|nr:RNA polymerase sigma factor [Sporanaerobacter sp. PP17-6a]SCL94271.1 RNA polymerase sigma factor SigM [Sporanaerobacter sp. PP17-6a]
MRDFEKIYTEYFSDVYKYVLTICRNGAIAEEVTQETFFKAMRHINQFNGSCKLYVWLCQIAKNT